MKRTIICILLGCILLSGCDGMLDGHYVFVEPHREENSHTETQNVSVRNFDGLLEVLRDMVENGTESGLISVAQYSKDRIEPDMDRAMEYILTKDPIGTYAVKNITYDLGTSAGQPAVSLNIEYLRGRSEIRKIQRPGNWIQAEAAIATALDGIESGIVLYVEDFREVDFKQWVSNYAMSHPDKVMELPDVTVNFYPETGRQRVIELKFTYQNSRDSLRVMQRTVARLFSAAAIYADGEGSREDQFYKLYSFLMGLSPNFRQETSITPAYSLLQHGVGDSRAFATVFAAMCEQAELECITVIGTRNGAPWYWNIICVEGGYYHLDLLECHRSGDFSGKTDEEMTSEDMNGYVWDPEVYPACGIAPEEETVE